MSSMFYNYIYLDLRKPGRFMMPTGETAGINNLSLFCRIHRLSRGHMGEVMNGSRMQYKGFRKADF
jgi:hypothetical protein